MKKKRCYKLFVITPRNPQKSLSLTHDMLSEIESATNWGIHKPQYNPLQPTFDLKETKEILLSSDLVVADLSDERPSCYFELGLAEALNRPIVAFAKTKTPIHQTSVRDDVAFFSSPEELKQLIISAISKRESEMVKIIRPLS